MLTATFTKSLPSLGTKVTFKPDGEIFPDTIFRYEVLIARVRELDAWRQTQP